MKRISMFLIFSLMMLIYSGVFAEQMTIFTENSPPLNYEENGQPTGSSVEIVRAMLDEMNSSSKIEVVPWSRGYKMVQNQPYVALFSTTRTDAREDLFKWVGPLAVNRWNFWAKKGSGIKINSMDDARKVRAIGTYQDDVREKYLKDLGFNNLDSNPKNEANVKKLLTGRIDLWISGTSSAVKTICEQNNMDYTQLEPVYTVKEAFLYIAISKSTPDPVVKEWQKAYDKVKASGLVEESLIKYGMDTF